MHEAMPDRLQRIGESFYVASAVYVRDEGDSPVVVGVAPQDHYDYEAARRWLADRGYELDSTTFVRGLRTPTNRPGVFGATREEYFSRR